MHGLVVKALDLDQGVWDSITVVLVMCHLGQALNPCRLWTLSSNGYQVEQALLLYEWLQLQKVRCIQSALHSPQGGEIVKE